MSLYNNIADSLASRGALPALSRGAVSGAASEMLASFGGGKTGAALVGGASASAGAAASKLVNKHLPPGLREKVSAASTVLGHAMSGNWDAAGEAALEAGVLNGLTRAIGGSAAQQRIRRMNTPLMGGGSIENMQRLMERTAAAGHVRQNLFVLEISSFSEGDFSEQFNMLAVDVSYDAFSVTGEKLRVGGALVDKVTGQEAVELRLSTFDNQGGDLKKFFGRHHGRTVARDGTVGVPADYAIRIKVLHGVIEGGPGHESAYADEGLFRVQTMPVELSRREQGLQELQLTFSQLDTFIKV